MSFSSQVKEELNLIQIKGNCCKRAFLYGALMSASSNENDISLTLSDTNTADKVVYLLKSLYKLDPVCEHIKRGCFSATKISFSSKKLSEFISFADSFSSNDDDNAVLKSIFSCQNCMTSFLRGVFCACGSVSDPQKSYTLEIRVNNSKKAELICHVIEDRGIQRPCITERKNAFGLFYRNESSVEDILTACGVNKSLFAFFDASVKKDLRNIENRATNCVAKNILKSVETAAAQINEIEALMAAGALDELSAELRTTARLRRDNPDISLSELALMHIPPLSKSGLNHRLSKIIDEAKKKTLK